MNIALLWRRGTAGTLGRIGACMLCCGLSVAGCTEPHFRDLDASDDLEGGSARKDASTPEDQARQDAGNAREGGDEMLAQLQQSMVGKYYLRTFVNVNDSSKPLTTGLSLIEIRLADGRLSMDEQLCYYAGVSTLLTQTARTTLDASMVPAIHYELTYDGEAFDSDIPPVGLGYDLQRPPGCDGASTTAATSITEKPWLQGQPCLCPTDLASVPAPNDVRDCRIHDAEDDGDPGITLMAKIEPGDWVEMYVVQRSRDQYVQLRYKNAERTVLLANLESVRIPSVLGCSSLTSPCTLPAPVACPAAHNTAEFVRLRSGQQWTCDGLRTAEAIEDTFREAPRQNCYGGGP